MTTTLSSPDLAADGSSVGRRSRRPGAAVLGLAVWLVAMLAVPWVVTSDLWMGIGIFTLIGAVGALGMQVVMGFAGQISLGHAAFMAIGAYTAAWLGADQGQPWWISMPAAAVVAGLGGAVFAPVAVRIRGLYLAVATIALVFIVAYLAEVWKGLSGGAGGRVAAPVVIGGQDLLDGYWSGDREVLTLFQAWWYFALGFLLVAMVVTWNIRRSRLGRAFMAVRDKDIAAGVAGIPVTATKVTAFAISSAFAGLCGALLTAYMGFFTPTQWTLMVSVEFIAMVVIGGVGTVAGALLGAFFVRAMPELVNWIATYLPGVTTQAKVDGGITAPLLANFLYGLVLVLVLLFEPNGLRALLKRPFDAIAARRGRSGA